MVIDPEEIRLTLEQQERLERIAEQSGQLWQELLARVIVTVPKQSSNGSGDQARSAYDLLSETGPIGCIEGQPEDVSNNAKYMDGFGECANEKATG